MRFAPPVARSAEVFTLSRSLGEGGRENAARQFAPSFSRPGEGPAACRFTRSTQSKSSWFDRSEQSKAIVAEEKPPAEREMEISFTDRELDVMGVLWDAGSATVAEVRDRLADDLAYTTVLTVLRTLEEKGYVGHTEEGKAYRYRPLVERQAAGTSVLRRITRKLFKDSPELLLTHLVSDRALREDELERMRRLLEERLKEERE
jgi:BlaI family transcriptional regulator, penicillinase repressor